MSRFAEGILSLSAAAVIVGILGSVCSDKKGPGALIRMICGLFLGIHILSGLLNLDFHTLVSYSDNYMQSADAAVKYGSQISSEVAAEIIKTETEAYILDKAGSYGAAVEVEVLLTSDDIPVPHSVQIKGNVSPYARSKLAEIMERELGIAKEMQNWIG